MPTKKKHKTRIAQYKPKTVGPLSRSPSGGAGPNMVSMMGGPTSRVAADGRGLTAGSFDNPKNSETRRHNYLLCQVDIFAGEEVNNWRGANKRFNDESSIQPRWRDGLNLIIIIRDIQGMPPHCRVGVLVVIMFSSPSLGHYVACALPYAHSTWRAGEKIMPRQRTHACTSPQLIGYWIAW